MAAGLLELCLQGFELPASQIQPRLQAGQSLSQRPSFLSPSDDSKRHSIKRGTPP